MMLNESIMSIRAGSGHTILWWNVPAGKFIMLGSDLLHI